MVKLISNPEQMSKVRDLFSVNKRTIQSNSAVVDVVETVFRGLQVFAQKFMNLEQKITPAEENYNKALIDIQRLKAKFEDYKSNSANSEPAWPKTAEEKEPSLFVANNDKYNFNQNEKVILHQTNEAIARINSKIEDVKRKMTNLENQIAQNKQEYNLLAQNLQSAVQRIESQRSLSVRNFEDQHVSSVRDYDPKKVKHIQNQQIP